jgi:hypothetical protein
MKALARAIGRRFIATGPDLFDSVYSAQLGHQGGFEFRTLIRQKAQGYSETRKDVVNKAFCDDDSRVCSDGYRFGPLGKNVDSGQQVFVTVL